MEETGKLVSGNTKRKTFMASEAASLAYHEPTIITILNQSGFLLSLNLVNAALDALVYCGLVGQLFVGVLWGVPGAQWLSVSTQELFQQLGYLGLVALVYEGGLSVSFASLTANLVLSVTVALTGMVVPIALSFALMGMLSATPLQAFAAGAALSATSLGTTFTILSSTGLMKTRLGIVTTSAAMLDDVVGLVMVQVITNLGSAGSSFQPVTVLRPVLVSVGLAVGLVGICRFVLKPLLRIGVASKRSLPIFVKTYPFAVVVHTCVLVGLVTGATYAGASSLFAAYLAGAAISWFDDASAMSGSGQQDCPGNSCGSEITELQDCSGNPDPSNVPDSPNSSSSSPTTENQVTERSERASGELVYERYYKGPVDRILKPLFFASIGFAIPITDMFDGRTVWRGIIYAVLMALAKVVTGVWLCNVPPAADFLGVLKPAMRLVTSRFRSRSPSKEKEKPDASGQTESRAQREAKPASLYPSAILGLSMVARGEIGYLIASLAETKGVFSQRSRGQSGETSSEIYLVVIWAITLCTIVGPVAVGTLVRRVRKLRSGREKASGVDPLGSWGI